MPEFVYPPWKRDLAQLWNGTAGYAPPAFLYMGLRTGLPTAGDALSSLSAVEIAGGGYARVAIARNTTNFPATTTGSDWQYILPYQIFPTFSAAPSPNGATHFFLCDQSSGYSGNLYACGPLNPSAVSTTLSATAAAGATLINVPAVQASLLNINDWVLLGTTGNFNPNQERVQVAAINTSTGDLTISALAAGHVAGEPMSRDGSVKTYAANDLQYVRATFMFMQG